jgi:hypothetical protein
MKLSFLMILLLPRSTSFIFDGSREAAVVQMIPPDSGRRAAMAALLAPLVLLPPVRPARADASDIKNLIIKVDAMATDIKEMSVDMNELKLEIATTRQEGVYIPALVIAVMGVFGTAVASTFVAIYAKQDLSSFATKEDVSRLEAKTKETFAGFTSVATKTKEDLAGVASQIEKLDQAQRAKKEKTKKLR